MRQNERLLGMAELMGFEPNLSPFFTFSIYKASRYLKLKRKFREIFTGELATNICELFQLPLFCHGFELPVLYD